MNTSSEYKIMKRNLEKLLINQSNKYYSERILKKRIHDLEEQLKNALKIIDSYYLKEKLIERSQRRKTLKERKNKK